MAKRRKTSKIISLSPGVAAFAQVTGKLEPRRVIKSDENWSDYTLDDETVIRIKPVMIDIQRSKGQFNVEDDPVYLIKSGMILNTVAAPHLKKGYKRKRKATRKRK